MVIKTLQTLNRIFFKGFQKPKFIRKFDRIIFVIVSPTDDDDDSRTSNYDIKIHLCLSLVNLTVEKQIGSTKANAKKFLFFISRKQKKAANAL